MSDLILSEVVKWALLLLILVLLYLLWLLLSKSWQKDKEEAYGSGGYSDGSDQQPQSDVGDYEDSQSRREPAEDSNDYFEKIERRLRAQKEGRIRKLIEKDPNLAKELLRNARMAHLLPDDLLKDPDAIKKLAEKLPDDLLDIMEVVSEQAPIDLDLESGSVLKEVNSGGVYHEVGRMKDISQLPQMRPSEWALPRSLRRVRMLTGQARRTRSFDFVQKTIMLFVLEDGSGSMVENHLRDGRPRWKWARGVVIKLAMQAIEGKSKFIHRLFDAKPHPSRSATNPEEARKFYDWALNSGPTTGDTHIWAAFAQAIEDIRAAQKKKEITEADILLVSDGDDTSMDDTERVKTMLGNDIRLHVIQIGRDNESLRKVATTYKKFS